MAIQQDSKPALPPRPTEFSGCAKTPPAWLVALTRHSTAEKNHVHDFYLCRVFGDEVVTGIICKTCHKRFMLTTSVGAFNEMNVEPRMCILNHKNSLHHFHTEEATELRIYSRCCICDLSVFVEISNPILGTWIFNEMSRTRSLNRNGGSTHYPETIRCLSEIVKNYLDEGGQPLNIDGNSFKQRIGYDEASRAFFQALGYTLGYEEIRRFHPPPSSDETRTKFKYVLEELDMKILELNEMTSNSDIDERPWGKLNSVLGTEYKKHHATRNYGRPFDPSSPVKSASSILGCLSDMDDDILVWAYELAIKENPEKTPVYLQAVFDLTRERKSELLEDHFTMEISMGKFRVNAVNDAYHEMRASSEVSDETLIEAYRRYILDDPLRVGVLRDALNTIGKSRNSSAIENFLSGESYHTNSYNYFSNMPVGLDNIGNTCYLNSLLQYYFTIRNLREAVFASDSVSINGIDQWESITIGGRKVSKAEVERAQKFVTLLRHLFDELMRSSRSSITPDSDLAYLALVNAKNDEEQTNDSSRSPMDTTANSVDMLVDDLSPGPSSTRNNQLTLLDSSEFNNNNIVNDSIISGIAPHGTSFGNDTFYQMGDTFMNQENDYKGKGKENSPFDVQMHGAESFNDTKEDKLKKVSGMLFGKQQDVTECMDNVMFQLEAALKSTIDSDKQDVVKSLFYGSSRQILRYKEPNTVVAEGRDLYDGLDVYFDTSTVDFNGTQAEREVTLVTAPPILQIQVQRVQFDRSTSNIYKSNAYLRFEEVIYLDRYLDRNRGFLRERIAEARSWKQEIDSLQEELKEISCDKKSSLSTIDLLRSTAEFVQNMRDDDPEFLSDDKFDLNLSEVRREGERVTSMISDSECRIGLLRSKLEQQYVDLKQCEYRLHAVFIHSGQATFGHYWIYIYDFDKDRWLKYNDSYVTEVDKTEVFADTTGSSANPYCMVYVRAQ
ncbi:15047_t:CDS:10, partial [Acaulospora morrowiae]